MNNLIKTNLIGYRCILSLELFIKDPYAFHFKKKEGSPDTPLMVAMLDGYSVSL